MLVPKLLYADNRSNMSIKIHSWTIWFSSSFIHVTYCLPQHLDLYAVCMHECFHVCKHTCLQVHMGARVGICYLLLSFSNLLTEAGPGLTQSLPISLVQLTRFPWGLSVHLLRTKITGQPPDPHNAVGPRYPNSNLHTCSASIWCTEPSPSPPAPIPSLLEAIQDCLGSRKLSHLPMWFLPFTHLHWAIQSVISIKSHDGTGFPWAHTPAIHSLTLRYSFSCSPFIIFNLYKCVY